MDEMTHNKFSDIQSWEDFRLRIKSISNAIKNPIFRGQGNAFQGPGQDQSSGWRLSPSLYRTQLNTHPSFIQCVKQILKDPSCKIELKKIVGRCLNEDNPHDRLILIAILRHIGIPTPLLDWSKNPYISAYFAFKYSVENSKKVTVFLFDQHAWKCNTKNLTARDLELVKPYELDHSIPRQSAQESFYTYSRNNMVYSELIGDEYEGEEYFISYCSLPIEDTKEALEYLESMGIYEKNLFPDKQRIDELKKELHKHVIIHMK